ncbi:DNA replication factor Cdt1 isoform X2 [Colius striatus]|uniref:DNA replication factor Cdt1 isoform X2 n=1 Tax=Colius striatus TaxID=57412 RepID=UPI002B1E7DE0|nr:DNA replication factor Cdt1 isoform X2 [Colius striatus]
MAQLRLTDFYGRTKAATVAPGKRGGDRRLKAALAAPAVQREAGGDGPAGLLSSPRTPCRDGSPAVPGLAGRKRNRREMEAESPTGARFGEPSGKSARKRLELNGDAEPEPPLAATSPSPPAIAPPPTMPSLDLAASPPGSSSRSPGRGQDRGTQPGTAPQETPRRLQREDVAGLRSRLQKVKALAQLAQLPPVSPGASSELRRRLQRVQQLEQRIREKKAASGAAPGEQLPGDSREAAPGEAASAAEAGTKAPAYQRFHTLAQDLPPGLTLPYKFKVLAEMFRSLDTIAGMLFNRAETITFAKVKQGVQDMMRKQFAERHLGQITAVFPTSYRLRQEKNVPTFGDGVKKSEYQLTLEPVLGEEEKVDGRPHLSASRLLARRKEFNRNLVNIVKQHHKAFLAALSPPMEVPEEKLTRWHPRFNVDEVPDIIPAELPRPPQEDRLSTAQEVLSKARGMLTPKMEKALANLASRSAETSAGEPVVSKAASPASTSPALKGVSQALLDRIRAKEAQKLQALLTRGRGQEERVAMLSRLPAMARALRSLFVAERKPALPMEVACARMADSCDAHMAPGEMEKHLRLFAKLLPDWVSTHSARSDTYIKLDKDKDLGLVMDRLTKAAKEAEAL